MSIKQTPRGGWQVRWRDELGRQRARTFSRKEPAKAFHAEVLTRAGAQDQARRDISEELDALLAVRQQLRFGDTARDHTQAMSAAIDVQGFHVYCLWGDNHRRPLYVGMSSNVLARIGDHLRDPSRRHLIQRVTLTRCETAEYAAELESALIRRLRPELNIVGVA